MSAGVQMVLAMGYSVTVSAAVLLMTTLYEQLFAGQELTAAIRRARLELYNQKGRRAYFNQTVDLEDWLLPVVYQNRAQRLQTRAFTPEESAAHYERQARRYRPPQVSYGFVGRDLDILHVERGVLARRNLLLVRGMGGAGKTTLLHHLAAWWQTTGLVEHVWYFGYDERAWSHQQIVTTVARDLLGEAEYVRSFQSLSPAAQQARLAERLRAERHLLILDNLESITGAHLAIRNTLPEAERERLRELLAELAGGRTLVLLGSRGGEEWLAPSTFEENVYDLPGLDPEAASALADRILERHGATRYREDADVQQILKLLAGYPLPLEVVLANLARQTPAEVLAALQAGDEAIDMRSEKKTESILRCIEYSHANLSPDAQRLLACLAPFTGVIYVGALEQYSERLRRQPALAGLPFERWPEVLEEAANWGLLAPDPQAPDFVRLQPILPYFLRARLSSPPAGGTEGGLQRAIEAGFREHYDSLGGAIAGLLTSREAQEKQRGQVLARLEYENLVTAVNLALEAREAFYGAYSPLYEYLLMVQDGQRRLDLCQMVMAQQDHYTSQQLSGEIGVDFYLVLARLARTCLEIKEHETAKENYERALAIVQGLDCIAEETRAGYVAIMYHNLGAVAQAQRQWAQAERYYQQALEIFVACNDRYEQAKTYHQLGMVAQAQRQWAQAERYYQQALEIFVAFNDRYAQAKTYHQLGMVAQAQRQWAQAERYYQQALEIFAFNDRYEQAKTYHQLGRVAQAQRQWAQARDYFLSALRTYHEYQDGHNAGIALRSLARLWEESGNAGLPAAVAAVLGVSAQEAEALLRAGTG